MRLLFDVTRLQQTGLHTGIQRVVRCLLAGCAQAGIPSQAVTFQGRSWHVLNPLVPHPLQGLPTTPQTPARSLQLRPGDVLLLFDASWYLDPWPAVDAALQHGVRLAGMVHDLLPLRQPQWFRPDLHRPFLCHLQNLLERAERLFVPSMVVEQQLKTCLPTTDLPIHVLPHGGDFLAPGAQVPKALCDWPGQPCHLVVATLEPRKQHGLVLDAFEALWATGRSDVLMFVGARGWGVETLVQRIERHPELGRRLLLRHGLTDPELAYAYRHAASLIYLSRDEGFGLPVLEAAMQHCPVWASDIPVLREAGGKWPTYLDPTHIVQALWQVLDTQSAPVTRSVSPPRRLWRQVATELHTVLLGMQNKRTVAVNVEHKQETIQP